jgi:hypothetical protein
MKDPIMPGPRDEDDVDEEKRDTDDENDDYEPQGDEAEPWQVRSTAPAKAGSVNGPRGSSGVSIASNLERKS